MMMSRDRSAGRPNFGELCTSTRTFWPGRTRSARNVEATPLLMRSCLFLYFTTPTVRCT